MHQYLFFIGNFPIRMYGIMLCIAIFMASSVAYFLAWRDGRGWEQYLPDIGIYGGFCGLVGARLWDVFFFDWAYYSHHLSEIPFVWQGGMAIQGGIVGGVLAGALYCRYHKVNWLEMLDIICPALFIGQSIGRMANLLNGDAFGHPTGGNFGLLYPEGTLAHSTYGNAPLWPAEVWEGQIDVILFAILLLFQTTRPKKGQPSCLYVMLYSLLRFFLEFLRGDYVRPMLFGLKSAQVTSLFFFLAALALFIWAGTQKPPAPQPVEISLEEAAGTKAKGKGKNRK